MFAGTVSFERPGRPVDAAALAQALLRRLTPLHDPDTSGSYRDAAAVLAQALNWNTPESQRETVPTVCPHTGNVLVSWLRLDNRAAIARELGIPDSAAARMTDPDLVLAGYRAWGAGTARHLEGDFALAVYEPATRRVYLARDPLGIRPLYYAATPERVAFATVPACFADVPGIDSSPSPEWVTYYLAGLSDSRPGLTALAGVCEVLPGHQLTVADGIVASGRYHAFRDDPPWTLEPDPRHLEAYREQFLGATRARMRSAYPLGAENSGGLDSASIIGVVRELAGADAAVETFGMPEFTGDERCMRLAVDHTSFGLHLFDSSEDDIVGAAIRAAHLLGHPPESSATYCWRPFVSRAAALGVRTILSGNGGDDAVTTSGDLLFRELALHRQWAALRRYRYAGSPFDRLRMARFVARQFVRPSHHRALRRGMLADLGARPLSRAAVEEFGLRQHVLEESRWTAPHDSQNAFTLGDQLGPIQIRRAAESNQVAFADKVEYRYPMLDARLIQVFLSTPTIEKRSPDTDRYLHRRAMQGYVPDGIRLRAAKNAGVPIETTAPAPALPPVHAADLAGTPAEGIVDPSRLVADTAGSGASDGVGEDFRLRLVVLLRAVERPS